MHDLQSIIIDIVVFRQVIKRTLSLSLPGATGDTCSHFTWLPARLTNSLGTKIQRQS